jgi:phage gpG-like protein
MITGEVIGGEVLAKKLLRIGPITRDRLATVILRLTIKLQGIVKQDKLSGQVLRAPTGTLRRSITQKVIKTDSSIVGIVGTNVPYARPHEFGFKGNVTVQEHLRTIKVAWGREIRSGPIQIAVRGHTRRVNMPERSFLRSALREMTPEIEKEMLSVITTTLRGAL